MFEDDVFQQVSVPVPEAIGAGSGDAPVNTKADSLVRARDQKIQRLGSRVGYGELDATNNYLERDGYSDHLGNKILNDYSQYELDYIGSRLNNAYGVLETPEGLMRQAEDGSLTPYQGDPNDLMSYYEYGTRDGNIKRGTWGGRDPSGRYSQEYLNSKVDKNGNPEYIGETGVDVNQLKRHYLLPSNVARAYEALQHGSSQSLQNRVARQSVNDLAAYQAARDLIGSGATEVYRPVEAVQPEGFDGDTLFNTINDRFQFAESSQRRGQTREEIANEYRRMAGQEESSGTRPQGPDGAINRAVNTAAAVGAGLTRSLILDSAAAAVSLFGGELGTADSRRETANDLFGYDESFSQDAMKRVSDRVERMYDAKELNMDDLLAITGDAITNPEILGDSLGVLLGTVVGLGKFTKVGKAVSSVEKGYRAGALTKTQAKEAVSQIKSTASLLDKAAHLTAAGAGYGATVAGMTNNSVDEFMENNGGEADVFDVLRIGAFQAAIAGVDRFAGQVALRDIPGIRSMGLFSPESTKVMKEIVSEMPANMYEKAADSVARVLAGTTKLAGTSALEGITEYAQTMAEVFSTQYASEKYGDDFGALFADRANQIEALTGAAIGTAMGAEMHLGNLGAQTLQSAAQSGVERIANARSISQAESVTEEASPEEVEVLTGDRKSYNDSLDRLRAQFFRNELNQSTLAANLADLGELDRTRYAVENTPNKTKLAQADAELEQIKAAISQLVLNSPQGNVALNTLTPATAAATLPRQQVGPNPDSFTNVNAQAARDQANALNLTADIEEEFAKGSTAKQVQLALDSRLQGIPLEDRANFIVQVRSTLGIPSRSTDEGKAEFTKWLAARKPASTLGSRPLSEVQQRALAETAIDLIASRRGAEITPEETTKLNNFGVANGVEPARIERILLSHASVESEATVEERGVLGRERNLDLMLGSGTTNPKRVQKAYDETAQWLSTTLTSINQLEEGVREAEQRAVTQTNAATKSTKPFKVVTGYQKFGGTSRKPNYFDIDVRHDGTKYVADTAVALARIADKKRTANSLNQLLNKFHQEATSYLDADSLLTGGGYRIPSSTKKGKGTSTEANYVENVKKVLASIPEIGNNINRVVLGENPNARWSPKGERARINSMITNIKSKGGEYTSSDVVYLHAGEKYDTKKSGESFFNSELFKESNPAGKEILAAIDANATIVLDSEYTADKPEGVLLSRYLQSKGYIPLGALHGDNSVEGSIFVPDTEENARRLAASKERAAQDKIASDAKAERQKRLTDLAIEEAAAKLPTASGRSLETIQADIEDVMDEVRGDFVVNARKKLQADQQPLTTEFIKARADQDMRAFMSNRTAKSVRDLFLAIERNEVDLSDVDELNPALRALVEAQIATKTKMDADAKVLMDAWKQASSLRLKGNELIGALNAALEPVGKHVATTRKDEDTIVLREVGDSVLNNSAGSTNTIKSYAVEYEVIGLDGSVYTVTEHPKFNPDKYPVGQSTVRSGKGTYTVLNVNEVTHNPTEYLSVTGTTPLNTIPLDNLPAVFRRVSDQMANALKDVIPALDKNEVNIVAGRREADAETAVRRIIDSPARSLIYDKDGNINESMATAMGIAIGDLIKTDSYKLTLGKKDTVTIANMFRVSESEVTPEMRKMAEENGTLAKSVAHNLGTSALKTLGISKLKANQVNRGQYERMVTDLGNYILAAAEKEGILKTTQEQSNKLAEVYRDGEVNNVASVTWFVHMPATKGVDKTTKTFTTTLNRGAVAMSQDYDLITDFMPDPANNRKEPRFGSPIPEADQADILSSIRNDVVGGNIPAEAKETLRNFMNTPYEMDLDNVGKFLSEIDNRQTRQAVLKSLGYVTISDNNPDYVKLPFRDKEIQEAINRDVENSIEQIREYYNAIQNGLPNEMYFPFYYTSNHRYMLNSNTLNGQADKLHRFFLYPKAHNVTYAVDRSNNTFVYNYVQDGESKSIDSSLYVRAALAQAMGEDIDKSATSHIVSVGNELLSMSPADIEAARKSLLETGSFTLTNASGAVNYTPAHLSHGLQGLEFLRKYKTTSEKTFSDALSAEYDALTSGFSNKMQQFGLTANRSEDFRRVGIIEPTNNTATLFQDNGTGMNDMLSDKSLLDSYKNLAKDTILDLKRQVKALPPKPAKLFEALSGLLPGADQRSVEPSQITISSALRSLFKPGFMIFNYSAGINRITTNLGEEMVAQMFKDVATADLKNMTPAQKEAAEALAKLVHTDSKKGSGISLTELQRRIRTEPISKLQTKSQSWVDGKLVEKVRPLEQYLIKEIINPTYGASVQESFNKNFSEFIEIQNATNDAFKLSFAVFGNLLQQRVTEFRAANNNAPITEADLLTIIGSLRKAFPVIAGPLSDALEDGVYVYTTETRTPKGTLATTVSPALRYAEGGKAKSRTLNPLIRSIVAAANAGAVLPFHALDGAQMSRMTNEFVNTYMSKIEGAPQGAGLLPVHDAIIPPLPFSDITGFIYNKNTVELNSTYSVMGEIQKMTNRVQAILNGTDGELKVDAAKIPEVMSLSFINRKAITENTADIRRVERELAKLEKASAAPADIADKKVELKNLKNQFSFANSFERVQGTVDVWNTKVEEQRATMFSEGTKVGVLITTPGGVHTVGQNEVDLSYLDRLQPLYEQVNVNVATPAANVASSTGVLYMMPEGLRINEEYANEVVGLDLTITPETVITVRVNDKSVGGRDKPLTEVELAAVETAWSQTVGISTSALERGATLLFAKDAVTTRDLGDDAVNGGSYVFNRVTESGDYTVTPVDVNGIEMYSVVKSAPEDSTALIDADWGGIMTEMDAVSNKHGFKNTVKKYKEHTKRCK